MDSLSKIGHSWPIFPNERKMSKGLNQKNCEHYKKGYNILDKSYETMPQSLVEKEPIHKLNSAC